MAGVNVDINARIDRTFSNNLDRATRDLNRFQSNAQSIGSSLGNIFSKFGAGLGLVGFDQLIKSAINTADNLRDLSKTTGIAVEQLSGLKLAATQSGTNLEDVASAVNKLSVNIGKNGEKFRQLGIDATDPLKAFQQLADVFISIENPQQRAALAAAALGKSWQTTAPLLAEGGKAIGEMIEKGQRFSGITSQMADQADQFNDKLSEMKSQFAGVVAVLAGPALNAFFKLSSFIDSTNTSLSGGAQAFNIYREAINGAAKVAAAAIDIFNRAGLGIGALAAKAAALARLDFSGFKAIDKAFGDDIDKASNRYDNFVKQLEAPPNIDGVLAANAKANKSFFGTSGEGSEELKRRAKIDQFIGVAAAPKPRAAGGRSTAIRVDNSAEREAQQITDSLNQQIKSSEKLLALRNDSSNAAQVEFELFGRILDKNEDIVKLVSSDKNQGQKIRLLNLASEIDALDRQDEKWRQLIEDANEFDQLSESIAQLSIDPEINLDKFNAGIAQIQDKLREGIISEDQAKGLFDNLGKGFNEGFVNDAKASLSTLSTFADEAARNIENSFADFLFDPFKTGLDGMLKGFLDFIRKAVAEFAASQVLNLLVGKNKGDKGGIVQDILGSFFHDGGIVGQGVTLGSVNPLVFAGAQRFHDGGFPGLAQNEVPAILQKGELVLTKSQQQNIGASDNIVNNIVINVQSNGRESPSDQGNKIAESFIRALAREEIKTANRPGNVLKPVTSFG